MLRTLRVRDLAIIDELELVLEPGLNVITGETGAGKSILLQALDVVLGGRPDADLVRTGADEATVEAIFANVPAVVRDRLAEAGMPPGDGQDEVLVRRVIARGGRTRAYVNGALGSLALLRELAPHLLHAYGLDEHQALRRVENHRELLDAVGGLGRSLVEEMRARHGRLSAAREAIARARADGDAAAERTEMLRAQVEELTRAGLELGEEETLAADRTRLTHAERLATLASGAEEGLYSGEGAVIEGLGRALTAVREAAGLDVSLDPTRVLLESALAELEEAGQGLGRYARGLAPDPERLEAVEERVALLARLKRKYAGTVEDLIRRRDELAAELTQVTGGNEAMGELEATAEAARRAAAEWAGRLSVERRRVARDLSRALVSELEGLALTGARFDVRFAETEDRALGPEGWDEVEFFLSTNAGEEPRSLARVASGGELSRIMLALKTLAAADERGATLIFDEVDAGIGGAVAEVVGRKLRQLGRHRQVLCITHLPLIAAFAEHHVAVTKKVEDGRTVSSARPLGTTDRVAELARMMAGERVTHEAREHAEQLLRRATGGARGLTETKGVE
jgi:DNA repair protein RecN (Recombination protein N)